MHSRQMSGSTAGAQLRWHKAVPVSSSCRGSRRAAQLVRCYQPATTDQQAPVLPPELRKTTAVLSVANPAAPGGTTSVYLLGMSHVSSKSVQQVEQLVRLVRPQVVLLELCRDRVGLLVDPELPPPQVWHSRLVRFNGLPEGEGYPTAGELLGALKTQPGAPVTVADIEADCGTLLATGLFGSVRPQVLPPGATEAPEFIVEHDRLRVVAPFGCVEFIVTDRELPPLTQFGTRLDAAVASAQLREQLAPLPDEVMRWAAEGAAAGEAGADAGAGGSDGAADAAGAEAGAGGEQGTVALLMRARARIVAAAAAVGVGEVDVVFKGVEAGRVEALVKAGPRSLSGLESSAAGGAGIGISPFVRARKMFSLTSPNLRLDVTPWVNAALAGVTAGPAAGAAPPAPPATRWAPWDEEVIEGDKAAQAERDADVKSRLVQQAAGLLTGEFALRQAAAGRRCGVEPGAAWRAALEAGARVGTQQVVLGDLPTSISGVRFARNVALGGLALLAAGGAAAAALLAAASEGVLPAGVEAYAQPGAAALVAAAAAPLVWPLVSVGRLAGMKGEEIEAALELREAIDASDTPLSLTGEDALLTWPGARGPLIEQRDAFMARALRGAATGRALAPAFVYDVQGGRPVYRYMAAEGGPAGASPEGRGDGRYEGLPAPSAVVAVVGTAHVRGMVREWGGLGDDALDVEGLLEGQ